MANAKKIKLYLSSLILFISLVSFSGFTGVSTQVQKPQTELLSNTTSIWASAKQNVQLYTTSSKVSFTQHHVFSFKCFLNQQLLNYDVTFKSQKKITLHFLKYQFLEQNLIAQINTSTYQNDFIK